MEPASSAGAYHSSNTRPYPQTNRAEQNARNDTSRRLNQTVIDSLREAVRFAQMARGKHIVAFIGETGMGKSTIINHMLGKTLVRVRLPTGPALVVDGEEIAPIGHGTRSATDYARTYPSADQPDIAFVDCGGFFDSRGVSTEVAVVASMKLTLEAAQSARLVLVCEMSQLVFGRARILTNLLKEILNDVLHEQASNSLVVAVTKPFRQDEEDPFPTTTAIIEIFRSLMNDVGEESDLGRIFQFILREEGKYVILYNPLEDQCRRQLNTILADLDLMPPRCFKPIYSAQAVQAIFNDIVNVAMQGTHLLKNHSLKQKSIATCTANLSQLNDRMARFTHLIAQLGQNTDPGALRIQREETKTQNQATIATNQHEISLLRAQIQQRNNRKATVEQQMQAISAYDNDEAVIWDPIPFQKEAQKFEYEIPGEKKKKSNRFVGIKYGSKNVEGKPQTVCKNFPIENKFSYQGAHSILRVEMVPPRHAACWSAERGGVGENSHFITYTTEPGEPANAWVKIFGKKKDLPHVMADKAEKNNTLLSIAAQVNQLSLEIQQKESAIHRAQTENNSIDHDLDNLSFYQAQLQELESPTQQAQAELNRLVEDKTALRQQIENQHADFQFIKDYKELSRDARLEGENISRFIRKHNAFLQESRQ